MIQFKGHSALQPLGGTWNGGDTGQGAGGVLLRKMHRIPACLAVEKETVKQENSIRGAVMRKVEGAVGS